MSIHTKYGQVRRKVCARQSVQRYARHLFVVFCTVIFGMSPAFASAEPQMKMFNIDEAPAKWSLTVYAQQAEVPLGFSLDIVVGVFTNPVKGEYDNAQALEILLKNTGLEAEQGERGILIRKANAPEAMGGITQPTTPIAKTNSLQFTQAAAQAAPQASIGSTVRNDRENVQGPQEEFDEIVVTGSQIRGAGAVGANVITIDREHIELTGLATTQEVLQSIPQNFGGGANEDTWTVGVGEVGNNIGIGSSVDLRGLGAESTLLLINGRRSAPGGGFGGFVDLNSVPATAIERVEVLADGASAIYGSDAIGGVVNVILRDDYEGAETRLRYAPGTSDIDEVQFSQVFGKRWESGNVMFTYEYYDRTSLRSEDRVYARDSDLTSLGGGNFSVPISNPGNIDRYTLADGTNVNVQFAIPEGQDGSMLAPGDLLQGDTNLQNIREGSTLLPSQERHSASAFLSQDLSSVVDLFADLRFSTREFEHRNRGRTFIFSSVSRFNVPSSNPFFVDPFGGSTGLRLSYSFVDDYGQERTSGTVDTFGGTVGATLDLDNSWQLEAYASYNLEKTDSRQDRRVNTALLATALADPDPATAFNPFGDGSFTNPATLAAIEGFRTNDVESELALVNIGADGELFDLPGGAAKLAIGAQFSEQTLESSTTDFLTTPEPVPGFAGFIFKLDRDIAAGFVELYLPFVTQENSRTGLRNLAVSIAGRYEDYSDFGDTFNPKFGVSWSPAESLTLRSTYGTSFRAPLLTELDDSQAVAQPFQGVPDPFTPGGSTTAIFKFGNNAGLIPEEGTTWTAGFDVTHASLPGFKVGLTYFTTEVDNLIALPSNNLFQPLQETEFFGQILQSVPGDVDVATVGAILLDPNCFFCSTTDPNDVGAIVDFRLNNLNRSEISGLDLDFAYTLETANLGSFNFSIYASHIFELNEQAFAGAPLEDKVDTFARPNSLKLRSSLSWNRGGFSAALFGNHTGDYTSDFSPTCRATPEEYCRVGSWTTWDLYAAYDFGARDANILEGTKVSLNVRNVFDQDPPFVEVSTVGVGFDPFSANPWGQFLVLQITKEW